MIPREAPAPNSGASLTLAAAVRAPNGSESCLTFS